MTPPTLLDHLLREDLGFFLQKAFGTVVQGDRFASNWHLNAITHHLEEVMAGRIRRLIINVPPRNAKSLCASVAFPAWILGRDPTRRIICVSYAQDLAVKLSNQTRTLMRAPWYERLFPGTRLGGAKNTEGEFETTRGGYRMATSVGGVLTGRGGHIIILDDPIKPADAMSEAVRTATNEWYDLSLLSRLDDKTTGAIILVMQRLHVDDLTGHLLEQGGWTVLNLPAIAEADQVVPIGRGRVHHRRAGDLLHPEREPPSVLEELQRSLGSFTFAAQYQQEPVPPGGHMIDLAWFRRYGEGLSPQAYSGDEVYQSWDTASKAGELNDCSVCTTWLVRDRAYYLLDVFRDRLGYPDLRRKVVEMNARWRPNGVLIEDKASGEHLVQDLRHAGEVFAIAVQPQGDKVVRASSIAAVIEGGRVLLPEHAAWLGEFEKEILAFPHGRHDDQVDAMSQFLIWARDDLDAGPRIRSFD
ncbi:MAG: phage terminase large subunit, partial [Parafilimonas terrae]|nr:phage terminase large subunit [Parafilimonas terrae]